jgi:site-specific DNA-cytosine methylase
MLLRLRDLGICETQIMSQLPLFAMASRENGQIGSIPALPEGHPDVTVAPAGPPAQACAGSKGRVYSRSRGSYLMVTCRALRQAQ